MQVRAPHGWDVSTAEARAIQDELRARVVTRNELDAVRIIAGIDISVRDEIGRAAVVLLSYPGLETVEVKLAERAVEFPYIPGLLSFREIPSILTALERVRETPDLLMVDGQGIAHPRRLGIASHLGVLIDRPAIGCAKSRLCGRHAELGPEPAAYELLVDRGEVIGAAVRSKRNTNPLYVSPGHRVDVEASIRHVLACCRGYRLPEPTRRAHNFAGGASPRPKRCAETMGGLFER